MITAKCVRESNPKEIGWGLAHDLEVGKEYEVDHIDMGSSSTNIFLMRRQKLPYNSVLFKFYEDGKELNIYKDKRFNKWAK